MNSSPHSRDRVFIVHGRNWRARDAMIQFLHTLQLQPLTWRQAVSLTGETSPTTFEVVEAGLQSACAIIVLITPDEQTRLRDHLVEAGGDSQAGFQPRPNVILEAGMALALAPERTILVQLGETREISDLTSFNYVKLTNDAKDRRDLVARLQDGGCHPDVSGEYLTPQIAGDFDASADLSSEKVSQEAQRLLEVQVLEEDVIFQKGIQYLKKESHGQVLIYAPTGVWAPSDAKKAWFSTLAGCLAKWLNKKPPPGADKNVDTTLRTFISVYGLPPVPRTEEPEERNTFAKALDVMENALLPFNGLDTAHIYYLEVDTRTIPGTGVIVIDDSLFTGFAVTGRHKVDYGLFIPGRKSIADEVKNWFNQHVMSIVEGNHIQEMRRPWGKSVKQGMDDIRERYGIPPRHRD